MKELWIEESGQCSEDEILSFLSAEADLSAKANLADGTNSDAYYLAGTTDKYLSGYATMEEFIKLELQKLLEIRIFSEKREFLASRSMISQDFSYRIASDEALSNNFFNMQNNQNSSFLPEKLEENYLIRYQYIDINENKSQKEVGENGIRWLMTNGGGRYSLPITKEIKMVKIMTYITYDENGMAKVADNRLCGFVKEEDKNAERN